MLNTSDKYLHIFKNLFAVIAYSVLEDKRYLSFSFHEYLLLQKKLPKEISTTISKSSLPASQACTILFFTLSCVFLSAQHPPPDFTVCLSPGSLQHNPGDKDLR